MEEGVLSSERTRTQLRLVTRALMIQVDLSRFEPKEDFELERPKLQRRATIGEQTQCVNMNKPLKEFLETDCSQLMNEIARECVPVGFQEAQWSVGGDQSISCRNQIGVGGAGRAYEVLSYKY
jgi:hypothetical protein